MKNRKHLIPELFVNRILFFLTLSALFIFSSQALVTAEQSKNYQSAEPKLDTVVESGKNEPLKSPDKKPSGTLKGSIQKLDKHNNKKGKFMFGASKAQTQNDPLKAKIKDDSLKAHAESSIGIIGVKFVTTVGRPPVVNEVFFGTPADKVGMRVNDVIVAVDGVPTAGLTKDEVFDLIIGTPDTPVSISIMRSGDYQVFNCTRMDINLLNDPRVRRDYLMHL